MTGAERWVVVDERRLPFIVFDTRPLADTLMFPPAVVAVMAVGWHTQMRQFPAPVTNAELASYGRFSTKTAERGFDQARTLGYITTEPRPGKAPLHQLLEVNRFPMPLWPSPWRHEARAPGLRAPAPAVQGDHRWLVDVHPAMDSFVQLDCRLLADTRVDDVALVVYAGICWHVRRMNRSAWPSLVTLASYAGCTPKRVRKALDELVAAGYLSVTARPGTTAMFVLLDQPPAPDGPSPWSTPDTSAGVTDAGPRETPEGPGARENGTDGPLRAKSAAGDDPPDPRHQDPPVVHNPRHQDRGPQTPGPTNEHHTTHVPGSGSTRTSNAADRPVEDQQQRPVSSESRDTPGQRAATTAATNRAIRLINTWAPLVAEDHSFLADFTDAVTREATRRPDRHQVDVDAVIAAATAALHDRLEHPPARPREIPDRPIR